MTFEVIVDGQEKLKSLDNQINTISNSSKKLSSLAGSVGKGLSKAIPGAKGILMGGLGITAILASIGGLMRLANTRAKGRGEAGFQFEATKTGSDLMKWGAEIGRRGNESLGKFLNNPELRKAIENLVAIIGGVVTELEPLVPLIGALFSGVSKAVAATADFTKWVRFGKGDFAESKVGKFLDSTIIDRSGKPERKNLGQQKEAMENAPATKWLNKVFSRSPKATEAGTGSAPDHSPLRKPDKVRAQSPEVSRTEITKNTYSLEGSYSKSDMIRSGAIETS